MNCPNCNKFAWKKDTTRKHGNASRYFVVCGNCGKGKSQCSKLTGKVFFTRAPARYVATLIDLEPRHKVWLKSRGQSATIRQLIDKAMKEEK